MGKHTQGKNARQGSSAKFLSGEGQSYHPPMSGEVSARRIVQAMEARSQSRGQVARESGVDRRHLNRILNGDVGLTPVKAEALARTLGVSAAWLLGLENGDQAKAGPPPPELAPQEAALLKAFDRLDRQDAKTTDAILRIVRQAAFPQKRKMIRVFADALEGLDAPDASTGAGRSTRPARRRTRRSSSAG